MNLENSPAGFASVDLISIRCISNSANHSALRTTQQVCSHLSSSKQRLMSSSQIQIHTGKLESESRNGRGDANRVRLGLQDGLRRLPRSRLFRLTVTGLLICWASGRIRWPTIVAVAVALLLWWRWRLVLLMALIAIVVTSILALVGCSCCFNAAGDGC